MKLFGKREWERVLDALESGEEDVVSVSRLERTVAYVISKREAERIAAELKKLGVIWTIEDKE